jgi:hypothetical protein
MQMIFNALRVNINAMPEDEIMALQKGDSACSLPSDLSCIYVIKSFTDVSSLIPIRPTVLVGGGSSLLR